MDHYVYTIPSQGSGQESKITQIASLEIKMHFIRSSSLFPQNMHTLFFSQDRSRKQTDEPWVKLYSKLFLLNCIQGLPASASRGTAQGSNDCIALKETITNNGCNSGMDEKWNFIITAFKGISISTDCCLFLKKKKKLSRFRGCGNHTTWFPTPWSFFLTKTVHAFSCSSFGSVTMQPEAFKRLDFVI